MNWGDFILDLSGGVVSVQHSQYDVYDSVFKAGRTATAVDSAGRLRVGGLRRYEQFVFSPPDPDGSSAPPTPDRYPGDFYGPCNFGQGGACLGDYFYCATDGADLVFLDGPPTPGTAPPGYRYKVTLAGPPGECCDLVTWGTPAQFAVVYATGIRDNVVMYNDWEATEQGNLRLTLFAKPEPATDTVAWIATPTDGTTLYLAKPEKGRVSLQAVDGAPGDGETYTWEDIPSGDVLGTGNPLVFSFADGSHEVRLRVRRMAGGEWREDTAAVAFSVQTYSGKPPPSPQPGITVFPTSGLQTTEAGGTDSFSVTLDEQPTASVTIELASSDESEGVASPSQLVFGESNWDVPQVVTVTGQDDASADGDIGYTIVLEPASSVDPSYDGLDPEDVAVTNGDDDGTTFTYDSTDVPQEIPDQGQGQVTSDLVVVDPLVVASLEIILSVTHERPSDLTVVVISPSETREILSGTSGTFTTTSFTGESATGTWVLEVTDGKKKKTGTLEAWSIRIGDT